MKHKHADLIHAWADGAQIQSRNDISGCWEDNRLPMWAQDTMYRIKPEPVPDEVQEYLALRTTFISGSIMKNLRLTFDGASGVLKSAEVL